MRPVGAAGGALPAYERALDGDDADAAVALVQEMLDAGFEPIAVLTEVVAAAQRSVGARWQRGEWTVAQEHAATAIAVASTRAVADHVRRTPPTRGRVLVACAEREWHALPAMIIDCVLRANGWDSSLLGAATSPLRMNQYLQDLGPEAVAVSCSVLGALPATRRFIEASTASGVPILVGGPAFGVDDTRAVALGATAWASDAEGAVAAMKRMPAVVPPASPLPADAAAEQAALELDHQRIVNSVRERWSLTVDGPRDTALVKAVVVTDDVLTQMLHAIWAVLLTGDPRPVPETVWWIADLLHTRGAGHDVVREFGGLLNATLRDYPLARDVVTRHFEEGLADFG